MNKKIALPKVQQSDFVQCLELSRLARLAGGTITPPTIPPNSRAYAPPWFAGIRCGVIAPARRRGA